MVATDTPNLGITSKPQNLGVTLTTQTTGSFRSFMVELQICNSPINHRRISAFGHSLIICVIIMIIQPAQFCVIWNISKLPRRIQLMAVSERINGLGWFPPMFAAGEFRKYQPVTAVTAPASSSGTLFFLSPDTSQRGDCRPAFQERGSVCRAYPHH